MTAHFPVCNSLILVEYKIVYLIKVGSERESLLRGLLSLILWLLNIRSELLLVLRSIKTVTILFNLLSGWGLLIKATFDLRIESCLWITIFYFISRCYNYYVPIYQWVLRLIKCSFLDKLILLFLFIWVLTASLPQKPRSEQIYREIFAILLSLLMLHYSNMNIHNIILH